MDPLNRPLAPFPADVWEMVDTAAAEAARTVLTARRFLDVEGPFGLGLTAIEAGDDMRDHPSGEAAVAVLGHSLAVPMLWRSFGLSLRRLAASLHHSQPLDLNPIEDAAESVARLEERLVYYGDEKGGLAGLLTAKGAQSQDGGDWSHIDRALRDVLEAVTRLDEAGFRGPYALAASPRLYNGLFRRYDNSDMLQVEHLGRLCTRGIYKAPIEGAVVVDPRAGRLVVGQDLMAGFAWADGVHARLFLSESIVLRLDETAAICRIATFDETEVP
jgi:uncharacterized linocin/CFP29 family protein